MSKSSAGNFLFRPWELTRMSTCPMSFTVAATSALTLSSSEASTVYQATSLPQAVLISSTARRRDSSFRLAMATRAPASARPWAMA